MGEIRYSRELGEAVLPSLLTWERFWTPSPNDDRSQNAILLVIDLWLTFLLAHRFQMLYISTPKPELDARPTTLLDQRQGVSVVCHQPVQPLSSHAQHRSGLFEIEHITL